MTSVVVSDTMTGCFICPVSSCCSMPCLQNEKPTITPLMLSTKEKKKGGGGSPKPSKWLTRETQRETALPLKRFEAPLSHQAWLITEEIDLLRFFNALCTPQ